MFLDDSVQDKRCSRFIERTKRQHSGAVHSLVVTDSCPVNLVHGSGQTADFLPWDHRIYAPEQDQLAKNAHLQALFVQVIAEGNLQARTRLFDARYSGSGNPKLIRRAGWTFLTTLISNRLVRTSKHVG